MIPAPMKRLRALTFSLATVLACAEAPPPSPPRPPPPPPTLTASSPKPPTPPVALAPLDVDPIAMGLGRTTAGPGGPNDVALAKAGIERLCDQGIARANAILDEVRAMDKQSDDALTWDTTIGKLDQTHLALKNAGDFPALLAVSHPDDGVREKAKACEPKIDKLDTGLWLDATLAKVVKRYAAKKESLPPARARLLKNTLRDFRRNGLELDAKGQARVREINEEVTKLGQDFDSNLAASHLTVQ